jgi:uncharacterized protein YuzE
MKLNPYPETDSLYFEPKAASGSETREVAPGVSADFAADGTIVGLDIEGASRLDRHAGGHRRAADGARGGMRRVEISAPSP